MTPELVYNKYQDKYVLIIEEGDRVDIDIEKLHVTTLHGVDNGIVTYQDASEFVEV